MMLLFKNRGNQDQEIAKPWRSITWNDEEKQSHLSFLNQFQPGNSEVHSLKFLLTGPVGAGKSSFFNSVNNVLQDRITTRAMADSISGSSFSIECKEFKLKKKDGGSDYPFSFTDIKGLENYNGEGVLIKDVVHILEGHVKSGYKVRIPQVIIMTKVDQICPLVKNNIEKIYTSKKIKEKMEECSCTLGVPLTCIFPVKNYFEEDITNTNMDILILKALKQIVHFANDYVVDKKDND
ncbi:hypothetical protein DNTS_002027 [Danionella cerebrum]|uniref:G domain-containing protein n=1 Tax=Danionella cerebrum TaxID=2873325 RepID=A0A553Q4Q4_9TELE|nr:hypothetical protein DNTS_002027 [Danionella translucida]